MQFSGYIRGKENSINCIFLKGNAKYQFSFHENTMPKIFSIMNSKFVWGLLLGEGNAKIKLLFVWEILGNRSSSSHNLCIFLGWGGGGGVLRGHSLRTN